MPLLFYSLFFSFGQAMAFFSVIRPYPQIYTRTMLYGVGRAESDAELRANLRLIAAILLAEWSETPGIDLEGVRGDIFDMVTNSAFYERGYAKSVYGNDERLWFCSYIGFEKVTSKWAKENHPNCKGYISIRLYNQDERHVQIDTHTVQIYF